MKGTASLNSSFYFEICNDKTKLRHIKGRKKSFQSRQITGGNRKVIGERVTDMTYPNKQTLSPQIVCTRRWCHLKWAIYRRSPSLKMFFGNSSYEYRKGNRIDESLMTSLKSLKSLYNEELKCRSVPCFIQYLSCEKDIEHYHRMVKSHSVCWMLLAQYL